MLCWVPNCLYHPVKTAVKPMKHSFCIKVPNIKEGKTTVIHRRLPNMTEPSRLLDVVMPLAVSCSPHPDFDHKDITKPCKTISFSKTFAVMGMGALSTCLHHVRAVPLKARSNGLTSDKKLEYFSSMMPQHVGIKTAYL